MTVVFFNQIEVSFRGIIADRSDFVTFLEMVVTIMSLIVSFTGLIFVETTRSIIEASEPLRRVGWELERKRLVLIKRIGSVGQKQARAGGEGLETQEKGLLEDKLQMVMEAKSPERNLWPSIADDRGVDSCPSW